MKKPINIRLYLILAAVNIAIFAMLWMQGGYGDPDNGRLLDWGANFAPLTLTGEPWRLLSSAFLHASWVHLLLNMYMLLVLGGVLERAVGSLRFGVIYLLSALGGSLLSAYWHGYHEVSSFQEMLGTFVPTSGIHPVVSVGASGALMGLAGAAGAWALWNPDGGSDGSLVRIRGVVIVQVIVINLFSGWLTAGVDQAAHCGGVLVGFLSGLVLCREVSSEIPLFRRVGLPVVIGVLGCAAMVMAAWHGQTPALLEWKADTATQRAADDAERAATVAKAKEAVDAEQEAKDVAALVREDERTRPAPVTPDIAAGTVVKMGVNPDHMIIGASGKYLYVTDNAANELGVVDIAGKKMARTIQGGAFKTGLHGCPDNYCMGRGATGVAVSADEHYAYVASMREDSLVRIDLTEGRVVDAVKVGRFPREVVLSSRGDRAFVLNGPEDTVSVVSVAHWPQVITTVTLSDKERALYSPFGRFVTMWLSPDDKSLFTNTNEKNSILEFDTQTYRLVHEHDLGDFPLTMRTASGNGVWLYSREASLAWSDPATLVVRKNYPICDQAEQLIATSGDGKLIAVLEGNGSMMRVIKIASRHTIGAYPVMNGASLAVFGQGNKALYVAGAGPSGGTLSILDLDKSVAVKSDPDQTEFLCPVTVAAPDQTE